MARFKAAGFDERMTLAEHLDELRTRIIVSIAVLVGATALCFWQNSLLLDLANEPLPEGLDPITLSPTEPFMVTLRLSVYGGLLLSLPFLLYQAYAYLLPAFSPHERRAITPFLALIPVLFIGGVAFAYFVVLPPALRFLLSFNEAQFDIELRASEYYTFFVLAVLAIGVLFQVPVGTLAVTRLGIVTPDQLAANRRYAVLAIAVAAMLLTGPDPATMILALVPVYLLFELSVLLARRFGRPLPVPDRSGPEINEPDPATRT